jgi:hypothetical protein
MLTKFVNVTSYVDWSKTDESNPEQVLRAPEI